MTQENQSGIKLSVLAVALSAALATMAPAHAQILSGPQPWNSGNYDLPNGAQINGGLTGLAASGSLGTLTNEGQITASAGSAVYNAGGTIASLSNSGVISGSKGVVNDLGTITSLSNDATINGFQFGIHNTGTITILNNNSGGSITGGSSDGIDNANNSLIGTLTNAGLIKGNVTNGITNSGTITALSNDGGVITGLQSGINNQTLIGTLTNTGTINGNFNNGIINSGTITALSNNGGTITGPQNAINNQLLIGTLANTGTIASAGVGVSNAGGRITLLNNDGGLITGIGGGTAYGVQNTGTISTLTNTGTISGNYAIVNSAGRINALNNGGTINGVNRGISNTASITSLSNNGGSIAGQTGIFNRGSIGTLTNTGLISGSVNAIDNGSIGAIGAIANSGGVIAGGIANTAANNLTINGGTGSIFGTLTGASGGIGSADIGQIINTASNLVFASGNQLLNDYIDVSGHTVTNAGSLLQINNRVTVTGDFAQSAGGSLMLGVASLPGSNAGDISDTGYGRLVVMGNAALASGSSVALKPLNSFAFAQGQRYVVLAALGTLTTGGVNYSATGFNVTGALQQDTANGAFTDLILTLNTIGAGGNTPVNNATDGNASAALGGLFNYTGNDAGLLSVFNPAAALGSSAAANKAGAQLSPAATGSAGVQATQAAIQGVSDVANAHIDTLRVAQASGSGSSGIATGERPNDMAVWGQAFGGQSTQNDRAGAAGYKAGVNGMLVGVDTAVGDQWRVGGLVDYANISIANTGDNTGSSGHVTSYGVLGYAGYAAYTWYLNLSAGVASQKYNTLRAVNFAGFSGGASGSFDGMNYSAGAQAGYPIKLDAATTLTPIGSLMYQRLHQDGYTETGSAAALQIGSASTTSIKSDLGAKLERVFKTSYGDMTPSAQLSWRHEYRDTGLRSAASFAADTTGSTGFVSQGAAPEKDTGVLVLGVTLARSQNLTLSGHYTLEAAGGYTAQTADVRLRYQF